MITRPQGMRLIDWADRIVQDLDRYGAFGRLDSETAWQDWGVQFLNNAVLGRNLPNPYNFGNWKEWAERFCGALS